ncbi:hypothetical protein DFJ73DRAFT_658593 [Zopfochytrium polystomum]|nr:hypothetical protein DFJ73DRAFT_658593 [Zopfochytrium polystomum]
MAPVGTYDSPSPAPGSPAPSSTSAASLIVSWAVAGKNVLVVGGDQTAASRTRFALDADASVTVVCPSSQVSDTLHPLLKEVQWINRRFIQSDLDHQKMVFVCIEGNPSHAKEVASLCHGRSIPVNVSTASELSDFSFMSTYKNKSLQVAISTNGNGPKLASKLRRQVALSLPQEAGTCLEKLALLRHKLREADPRPSAGTRRANYVNRVSEAWSVKTIAAMTHEDIDSLVRTFLSSSGKKLPHIRRGVIRVVRVFSSDVDDLTRRAFRALIESELVLADSGIHSAVLEYVSGDLLVLPDERDLTTIEEASSVVLQTLNVGQDVVRLISSDDHISVKDDAEFAFYTKQGVEVDFLPFVGGQYKSVHQTTPRLAPEPVLAVTDADRDSLEADLGEVVALSGEDAVSHIAYSLSDLSFVYPGSPEATLGHAIAKWSANGITNSFGKTHSSKILETRPGAAAVVHGAASSGSAVSALAASNALPSMTPELYQIATARLPVVIHAATQRINPVDFSISQSCADVVSAAYSGFALLSSSSVQEGHDLALVAHVVASVSKTPIVHFYDAVRVASERTKIKVLPSEKLSAAFHSSHKVASAVKSIALADLTQVVMTNLKPYFGHEYKLFEYVGSPQAEAVIVSLGPSASLAALVARKLSRAGLQVGALNVRLLRPWSARHFLEALPRTVKSIAVIDTTAASATSAAHGLLFLDVTSAFYDSAWNLPIPTLRAGAFEDGLENFTISAVEALAHHLLAGSVVSGFRLKKQHGANGEAGLHQVILWDVESDKTEGAASHLTKYLDSHFGRVQSYKVRSSIRVEPVSATHLRFSDSLSSSLVAAPHLVEAADFVSVHNSSILSQFDVVASLKQGGTLLVNRPGSTQATLTSGILADELSREIPTEVRAALVRKHVKLVVLDAHKISSDFTLFRGDPSGYKQLVLEAAFHFLTSGPNNAWVESLQERLHAAGENDNTVIRTKVGAAISVSHHLLHVTLTASWAESKASDTIASSLPVAPQVSVPLAKREFGSDDDGDSDEVHGRVAKKHHAAWPVVFKEAFELHSALRPDLSERTYTVSVTENRRLTPVEYDRNVFHIEFDTTGTGLRYEVGEALGVHGLNDAEEVAVFISWFGIDGDQVIEYERKSGDGRSIVEYRTVQQLLVHVVDIFGKPGKKFYQFLVSHASDMSERERIGWLGSGDGAADLETLTNEETPTFADVLRMFPSARPPIESLLAAIPEIKPRHYSIASAMSLHPNSVHLLVVVVDWQTKSGVKRFGQCTRYLVGLGVGDRVTVSIKPSVMKLPKSHDAPVIMAGLGTGMAPFRAFVEERAHLKANGKKVGPMALYFGSRHKSEEYLYGEEMEAYHADGLLTYLRPAFSRDQKAKVYIQHKIKEDSAILAKMMLDHEGAFYLCGPTWPVPDVKDALVHAFTSHTKMNKAAAESRLEELKEEERYVLEVY